MRVGAYVCSFLLVSSGHSGFHPQANPPDSTPPYRLLHLVSRKALQQRLTEAAASGYRVVIGAPVTGAGGGMTVALEKPSETSGLYAYQLLATSRGEETQLAMTEAGGKGFRLVPRTLVRTDPESIGLEGNALVFLMEKAPDQPRTYEYRVIRKILQLLRNPLTKEYTDLNQAALEGYTLVDFLDPDLMVMERASSGPAGANATLAGPRKEVSAGRQPECCLILINNKIYNLQTEVSDAAFRGFRVVSALAASPGAQSWQADEVGIAFAKLEASLPASEYLLLAKIDVHHLQKTLNGAAAGGFRVLPHTVAIREDSSTQRDKPSRLLLLMEHIPGTQERYVYSVQWDEDLPVLNHKIHDAQQSGFRLVGVASGREHVVILEKPAERRSPTSQKAVVPPPSSGASLRKEQL